MECANTECILGKMTSKDLEDLLNRAANKGAACALENIGLVTSDDKKSFREMVILFKNYKVAKRATASAIWAFICDTAKTTFRLGSRVVGIFMLMYILAKCGIDPLKIEQMTKVIK